MKTTIRKWTVLGCIALGGFGCGSELVYGTDDNGGYDTERAEDPEEQAEAALRADARYDALFEQAGREFGVPAVVLKGLAWAQTRYETVEGEQEFENRPAVYGIMALSGADLPQAAQLAGVTEDAVKTDTAANVRAMAALLSQRAKDANVDRTQVANWAPVLAKLSGAEDVDAQLAFVRDEVFGALRLGVGAFSDELRSSGQSLELASEYNTMTQELSAGPDYSRAVWRPSPNYSSRGGYRPKMVIIHTCEGSYSGCWGWQVNRRSGVSAHYTVNSTGSEITQSVRESSRAWHIGARYNKNLNSGAESGLNGVQSNYFTVGIEHAGYGRQSSWSSGLIGASAKLTCNITKDWGIPRDRKHIVGHGQLQPYNRTDPGRNWPWSTYLSRVNAACGSSSGGGGGTPKPPSTGGLVIDSNNSRNDKSRGYVKVSANWTGTAGTSGYYGTGYYYSLTRSLSDGAEFYFYLSAPARKTIDAWWTAGSNRSTEAPFMAFDASGNLLGKSLQNQTVNGGKWVQVGTWAFPAGWNKIVLSRWAPEGKVVIADAVRVR